MAVTVYAKYQTHRERCEGLANCVNPLLWVAEDGTPETWMWLCEVLDGLWSLVLVCDAETKA